MSQQSGLSRTGCAQQSHHLALANLKRHLVQRLAVVKGLAEFSCDEGVGHGEEVTVIELQCGQLKVQIWQIVDNLRLLKKILFFDWVLK